MPDNLFLLKGTASSAVLAITCLWIWGTVPKKAAKWTLVFPYAFIAFGVLTVIGILAVIWRFDAR